MHFTENEYDMLEAAILYQLVAVLKAGEKGDPLLRNNLRRLYARFVEEND